VETLEQLRRQLDTFADLGAVVHTMKALAAVNMHEYERAVRSLADYYLTVERGLQVALREIATLPTKQGARTGRVAAVVFGSDHGLCGRFNEDIAEYARARLAEAAGPDDQAPLVLTVGARARALLDDSGFVFDVDMRTPGSATGITTIVRRILVRLDEWQRQGRAERVYLLHNRPLSGGRYHPTGVQLLPVDLHRFRRLEQERWPSRTLPMHTGDTAQLLAALLRQYFFVSLFRASAESLAAENASRWAAMQLADKNLDERRRELLMQFLRRRQDVITAELLDVVSGYEASRSRRHGATAIPDV
jgi:F-type H+-transporting ATPase subunit gamma